MHGEQLDLVVAEEAADGPAALPLDPADEIDRPDAVRAAVDEIPEKPEARVGPAPPLCGVDEAGLA
jgi:hypothetical protein